MNRVLVIADKRDCQRLVPAITSEGYVTIEARSAWHGVREMLDRNPELIVMGEELPSMNGDNFLTFVRRLTGEPIIVIGEGGDEKLGHALFQGADAYLARPFDKKELLARIGVLLRRRNVYPSGSERTTSESNDGTGVLELLPDLTPVESKLMQCLLDKAGSVVTRGELVQRVWGAQKKKSTLRFYILRLRRKLESKALGKIINSRELGYRLCLNEQSAVEARS